MIYKFTEDQLRLKCINLTDEIKRGEILLNYDEITVFNSSILPIKGTDNFLVASRGWYGNVRSWDGINFVILTILNKNLKKIKQNILDVDKNILNENIVKRRVLKFKEFKAEKFVIHEDRAGRLGGPEDPRLFYNGDDIYIMVNQLNRSKKYDKPPRHMFVSKVHLDTLEYRNRWEKSNDNKDKHKKTLVCEKLSTSFEKNWGSFHYKNKLHMLYDINPLKIYEVDKEFKCKMVCSIEDKILKKIDQSYPDLGFHLRNSTNLVKLSGSKYLGLGHAVLDYKGNTDINKYLIPSFENSRYSNIDKAYFKKFFKLYTAFFYVLDMKKKEVINLSPFFQLPNFESKQELIFFPCSISIDKKDFVNISYSVGDNRSYFVKMHLYLVKISLYDKKNIDFQVNHNINPNYYLELIRSVRKLMGYSISKQDYYKFKDVDKTLKTGKKTLKKKKKSKKLNK
jgi:hypothetical protein